MIKKHLLKLSFAYVKGNANSQHNLKVKKIDYTNFKGAIKVKYHII